MKVLVVGSGGREHVLAWKFAQSEQVSNIFVAPGNAGTAEIAQNIQIEVNDIDKLVDFAKKIEIDLTFVGPEVPLVAGIVDAFKKENLKICGPNKEAARLEGSKVFAKNLMEKYKIPTAKYKTFIQAKEAIEYIKEEDAPIVIKAEGLAAGKGVIIAKTKKEAIEAIETIMIDDKFGQAGNQIVIEEFLAGEEATVLAFTDGETIVPMIASQDHKQAYNCDQGPNTGGMGAYAPAPIVTDKILTQIKEEILIPTLEGLKAEGVNYQGIIYCGLMIDNNQIKVLEYNVRFGDPEAQVVLPLLKTDLVEITEAIIDNRLAKINIEWATDVAVCVIMASGGYPVEYDTGKVITGIKEANIVDTIVFQAGTEIKENQLVTAGGRVIGVTALGNSHQETINKVYQGVEKIKFEDAHYRTDIGYKALK